jgi:hypothetical protein
MALQIIVLLAVLYAAFVAPVAGQHEHPAGEPGRLGKINFPVSCGPSVQPQFSSAVAMLHSFWFEKANDTFAAVAENDPTCGMAYWGIAMTHYHPIWEAPGPADLRLGSSERAQDSDPDRVALRERSIRQHWFIQEAQLHGNGRQTSPPVSA